MKISIAHVLAVVAAAQDVTITAPTTAPSSASGPVDKSFLGIMVETTSWWQYASQALSLTLIQNLVNRTAAPVIVRVGGTSGDEATYNDTQVKGNFWPYGNDGLLAPVTLGQAFGQGLSNVPDVRYIITVPFANSTADQAVQFTTDILQYINISQVEALEIGNEPNLYDGQEWRGHYKRNAPYTPTEYVAELQEYTDAILNNVPHLPTDPIFHVGSLADSSDWSAEDLFNAGLGSVRGIKAFAQHYYQSSIRFSPTMRDTYLDHEGSVIHKVNLNPQENLNYFSKANISTPIVISEAGSALGSVNAFERTIDAVLGSALWEVDWALLVMSKGISAVNMNQCNGCNFAGWWASDGADVFSQYYGLMFLADWLGVASDAGSDGDFQVVSLYDGVNYPNVSPYAGFVGGTLDRVAVLDLNEWNMTETRPRVERTFQVGVGADVKTAELRRLTGDGTDATNQDGGITYAGAQWTVDAPGGLTVGNETETVDVTEGQLTFTIKASEAVLITVHR